MNKRNRPTDNLPCWKSAGKQKASLEVAQTTLQ